MQNPSTCCQQEIHFKYTDTNTSKVKIYMRYTTLIFKSLSIYSVVVKHGDGGLVAKSSMSLATPWTAACQAPPSMGFFQTRIQEWVAISFSGNLPDPGIEPQFPALQVDSLLTEVPLTILKFTAHKYIHTVVQASSPSTSRTVSLSSWNIVPIKHKLPFLPSPSPW